MHAAHLTCASNRLINGICDVVGGRHAKPLRLTELPCVQNLKSGMEMIINADLICECVTGQTSDNKSGNWDSFTCY